MSKQPITCLAIGDFNLDNFIGLLTHENGCPKVQASAAPFGQVLQVLMDKAHPSWQQQPDITVVWTQPHAVIGAFRKLLDGQPVALETVLAEVDAYASALLRLRGRVKEAFVPTWVIPPRRGVRLQDMRHGTGLSNILMQMNLRLAGRLADAPTFHVLDARRWIEAAGRGAFHPKLWYMAKVPFGQAVFQEAVSELKSVLEGLRGGARKLIVLDLDDTLWGGVVGEVGWEQLTMGGHDPAGEAFVDFQRELKALSARGILLAVVSKNDETVALEAISRHPEMILRQKDLAGWKINWNDKAQNVADLAAELNLGLQSIVFIDNHPVERSRVQAALPEVLVPEWPDDPMQFPEALRGLACFETASISQEDRQRTAMYATEQQRHELKHQISSVDEWLKTLKTTVTVEPLSEANLPRVIQLLNKTNQMNLSTRRMAEHELLAWVKEPHRDLWAFHVGDRFGQSGLTGMMSIEQNGAEGRIVDFLLSCRVMGRKVEETMLATAVRHARSVGMSTLKAQYIATNKNTPCLEFWKRSGFHADDTGKGFTWEVTREYPMPPQVTMEQPVPTSGSKDATMVEIGPGATVFVTGATGFTGSALVRKLVARGVTVRALARPTAVLGSLSKLSIDWIRGDICDEALIRRAVAGVTHVIHLAGTFRETGATEAEHYRVQVQGTQCVARVAAAERTLKRFVHISTIGVHGHIDTPPADEATRFMPGDAYQRTKAEGELWLRTFAEEVGMPFTVVRPAMVFGPGDRRMLKLFKMAARGWFPIIGRTRGLVHLVHVDDLTDMLLLVAVHPNAVGEVFICGGPASTELREVVAIASEVYGVSTNFVRVPAAPVFALARLCELVCQPLGIKPPLFRRRVAFFTKDRSFKTEKMTRLLGFQARVSGKVGIQLTAEWYRANGWLNGRGDRGATAQSTARMEVR